MMVKKSGDAVTSGPKKMVSTADIADKRIGVLQGSAHDVYATKTYPKAQILQYRTLGGHRPRGEGRQGGRRVVRPRAAPGHPAR